jgi:hypothetical protein
MIIKKGGEAVYACIVSSSNKYRQGVIPTRLVSVYSCGDLYLDAICSIYNHFLKLKDDDVSIYDIVNNVPLAWEEFYFPGASIDDFPGNGFDVYDSRYIIYDYKKSAYYVNLDVSMKTLDAYLASLSQNTRSQIKRSMRFYNDIGKLQIIEADSIESARHMLEEMYHLGNIRKESLGLVSSMNPYVVKFNDSLLQSRFASNEIQVLKIVAGETLVGYLYNHVYNGIVYFYQCGFHYFEDNKIRPGLVAHTLAIVYNANKGYKKYDFGAGEDRYKKSLSNGKSTIVWVRLLKPTLKMHIFKVLKTMKERARILLARVSAAVRGKA